MKLQPADREESSLVVYLVWNIVPVVVEGINALVRERQDDQVVAGPG